MKKSNPRRSNSARRNRSRKRFAALGLPCAICGRPIDYSLPARVRVGGKWVWNDYAFELDEIVPVSRWREGGYPSPEACANDEGNHQPAHRICNRLKGNGRGNQAAKPVAKEKKTVWHSRKW